jgi:hypothetical protein
MVLSVSGCPPASIVKFLLASAYANRQHIGFLFWQLFMTPTNTLLFTVAVPYDARQHKGFPILLYNSP